MKTEKALKTKKITFTAVSVAAVILAIALITVFAPKQTIARATTEKGAEVTKAEQTMREIEKAEEEYQKSFDENIGLWERYFSELQKSEELPENFDEKAYIAELKTFSEEEKSTLIKSVETLDELDAKLEKLYEELFGADEDVLYGYREEGTCDFAEKDEEYFADENCGGCTPMIETDENFFGDEFSKACEKAEAENDKIQALKKEFDELLSARAELWDKVYASYEELDETFDYANFDEAKYIAGLSVLTAEEKEVLLKDLAKLNEISEQLYSICGFNCGRW